ncbi:MAG: magnesium-translocating P-type ATPase [Firmicutes bacterium]|nr:magnesium-translocating P-type ATPase [Bacillota bacterium]
MWKLGIGTLLSAAERKWRTRNAQPDSKVWAQAAGLLAAARLPAHAVLAQQKSSLAGLTAEDVQSRLEQFGPNEVVHEERQTVWRRLWENVRNPLVVLLAVLATVSLATGDATGAAMMGFMVVLGVVLRYFQEARADAAARELQAMVSTTATVVRDGQKQEVPIRELVPGDVVCLAAGDMVPGDIRLISARDLFVNQAALTGESLPVEKTAEADERAELSSALEAADLCFMGTNVESGTATAVVLATGSRTYFGSLAKSVTAPAVATSFDTGINRFTWLMIRLMAVMVPAVFLINGLTKGNWLEAFLFALAVAVGLTPEMLPMIVTVNLSKGALAMSRRKVIVKRLAAIQNFGAMDVLCTDKTGTITEGRVVLEKHIDIHGRESDSVLGYAFLNSFYQTGLKSMLDVAVLEHREVEADLKVETRYRKVDEIPFDFVRRRMSVVVHEAGDGHLLICKGAVEELLNLCTTLADGDAVVPFSEERRRQALELVHRLNEDGLRVLALGFKRLPAGERLYTVQDESELTLMGFLAFLDPPKATAAQSIRELAALGVQVKILTGDNDVVTRRICQEVGLVPGTEPVPPVGPVAGAGPEPGVEPVLRAGPEAGVVLVGSEIENMTDAELAEQVDRVSIFAKLAPADKERVIRILRERGHVVGFMGDGINDAPALRAADVGISVDSAVDIARESSDIILLENSLLVLRDGVMEGRRVFGNILKYIKMAASSNFGNMFSVVGGSLFLPFLPMLPLQILTNNLLYDLSQTAIPTDEVDAEWLAVPRKWAVGEIQRFILAIGPISSIFDYATFLIMLFVFGAWATPDLYHQQLFHTAWFTESLFTQTLIIHVIRTNKIPFLQSWASRPLTLTSLIIVLVGALLPFSPLAGMLGFVHLPGLFWLLLAAMLISYVVLTQVVKSWFVRRFPG